MGSENDKRLKDITKEAPQSNNNSSPQNNPQPNNNNNAPHKSNSEDINDWHLVQNPNQRLNPYDPRNNQNNNQNSNNNNNNNNQKQPAVLQRSQTQRRKNVITTKILCDAFRNYCIDNDYLNRPRFNDAIESIFRFNIPEMHYTYLSDKIYVLLDSSGDGKIQEDEFLVGFGTVLKDRNYRLLLSMIAMMSLPDKSRDYIEISEIQNFFYNSYIEAYRHLGHQIKKEASEYQRQNLPVASVKQLGKWAQKYEKEIKQYIENDLKQFFPNINNSINFEQFKRWISQDHTIYLQYGFKRISIATSLIRLDDITYEESPINNIMNYPSV